MIALPPFQPTLTPQEELLEAARIAISVPWNEREGGILLPAESVKARLREAVAAVEEVNGR